MIPSLDLTLFKAVARFDFVRFNFLLHGDALGLGAKRCYSHLNEQQHDGDWLVTIHDPSRSELERLVHEGEDPPLNGLELAVDFELKDDVPMNARVQALEQCFLALATRFRPEDHSPTGVGYKAAHVGRVGQPFHTRVPSSQETLVYGHKNTGLNFKLYLKRQDHGNELPLDQWRVRLEITMQRYGLNLVGLNRVSSLFGFGYRKALAKCFRVIDGVSVRNRTRWSVARKRACKGRAERGWKRAGVNAFGHGPMPLDALPSTIAAAQWRERNGEFKTIDPAPHIFHPHLLASALIGQALRQLDRRMAQRFSGERTVNRRGKSLMTREFFTRMSRGITYAPATAITLEPQGSKVSLGCSGAQALAGAAEDVDVLEELFASLDSDPSARPMIAALAVRLDELLVEAARMSAK